MTKDEALKLALEALEYIHTETSQDEDELIHSAINSLRQAIAEAEKQVSYSGNGTAGRENMTAPTGFFFQMPKAEQDPNDLTIAYMSGVYDGKKKRKWVGLTDDEIDQGLLRSDYALQTAHAWRAGVVFAMAQLKEKNT